jgi:hypothetical protein
MEDLIGRIQLKQRELGSSISADRTETISKDSYLNTNVPNRNKLRDIELKLTKLL